MIFGKKLYRLIFFFLSFTLLFQTLATAVLAVDDLTTPEPTVTEEPSPTPTEEITPTPTPTLEATPAPIETPAPTVTVEPTPKPLWIEIDGDTVVTNENVGEGTNYRFRNTNLIVRFTKVTKPGKLTIKEVKLTPEQITATGALSGTAYDITSDMENGSFLYDLTLPLPQSNQNVKVKFASNADSLDQSQTVSQA